MRFVDRHDLRFVQAEIARAEQQWTAGNEAAALRTVRYAIAESAGLGDILLAAAQQAGLITS